MQEEQFRIRCRDRELDLRPGRTAVMGILNVTPDSFSDGGLFHDLDAAVRRAATMLSEGAQVIDVGGESTRPAGASYGQGATPVPVDEEIRRVVPVVKRIATDLPEAVISVDTYKPAVADAALSAGAHIINDITGLRSDPELAHVAASHGAALVVMHSAGTPGDLPHETARDGDVVDEVMASLHRSLETAADAGVDDVIVDPGFGFGKTPRENLRVIAATQRLLDLGRPVLVGVSRKSTIGRVLAGDVDHAAAIGDRLFGSLGATVVAVMLGASLVRTHDVRPTAELLAVLDATRAAGADLMPFDLVSERVTR